MEDLKKSAEKQVFIYALKARRQLWLHGFIDASENEKIKIRLNKYQDKHKIEVTEKELS